MFNLRRNFWELSRLLMKSLTIFVSIFFFSAMVALCQTCNPQLKIFKVEHGNLESLYEMANSLKSQEGKVSFDPNSNSLIVFDCSENIERIAGVIKALDIREKQVEIKVLVVETTGELLRDLGISAAQVIIPGAKFGAIAQLLKTSKDTNVRSEMMVRTLSNRPAIIQVTKEEIIGTEFVIVGSQTAITSPITKPIGNLLEVLPRVNNDGTINVILRPSVSTMQEGAVPSESTILTQAVIKDGDTMAIGGVDTEREAVQKRGTLFGVPLSKRAATEKKKVVMFLTSKITE